MKPIPLMIWKEFKHIRSDSFTIKLMVFPVILQVLIMGYALTNEVKNTTIAVMDLSKTPQSRSLIESISHNYLFNYRKEAGSFQEIRSRLDQGDIRMAMIIPQDFTTKLLHRNGADIQVLVDGQDANSSGVASGYINAIISRWQTAFLKKEMEKKGMTLQTLIPLQVDPLILFNPLLKSTWFMVPALVVLLITIVTSLLSGLSIVKEKEAGTLEQLMVTPLKPVHVIFGKTIPYFLVGFIELCFFLLFAILWFKIPFRGNLLTFFLFGVIYMLSSLGIGILTSTIAKTPQQVLLLIWFILMCFILLSGFFIPVENMPLWVQKVTIVNPVRWFMFAVREIFLKGSGIGFLWKEAIYMTITGIIVFGASILFFHRRAG
ncbi:MAG TPA: ABC transporter permease [Chitinispirillaceae bacterium]|nr:ABC transporter permease [Chitinispirillaceae bacterium]